MWRLLAVLVAWGAGWVVYMTAMLLWSYDGLLSMLLQPLVGAVVSGLVVGLAWLAGWLLRLPVVRRVWGASLAAGLAIACVGVMVLGSRLGLVGSYVDPDTGAAFQAVHPAAALSAFFGLVFALANWPSPTARGKPPGVEF